MWDAGVLVGAAQGEVGSLRGLGASMTGEVVGTKGGDEGAVLRLLAGVLAGVAGIWGLAMMGRGRERGREKA